MKHLSRRVPLLVLFAMLCLASPGYGALVAPVGTTTAVGDPTPAFAWTAVAGATSYTFEIDAGNSIGTVFKQVSTHNTRVTLTTAIADGPYTWRVRAVNTSGNGPWSTPVNWTKTGTGPTLISPADGDTITYPDPIVLQWTPVDGAFRYAVAISDSANMSGAVVQTTDGTSYTPASWLSPGVHYWTVTAKDEQGNSVGTSPSGGTGSSFTWDWQADVTGLTVTNAVDASAGATAQWTMFDPQFSWDAVSGAVKYQVEVNTDDTTWSASSKVCCSDTRSTTLTPKTLLPNATYNWRVRAVDASGNAGPWTVAGQFSQTYDSFLTAPPATPSVPNMRMADNQGDPGTDFDPGTAGYQTQVPIAEWDPVPGASGYDVTMVEYLTGQCQWNTGGIPRWSVRTAATSFTPLATGSPILPWPTNGGVTLSTDSNELASGMSYCVRVTPFRDTTGSVSVSGDPSYLDPNNDGTAPAFTFAGLPSGNPCSPSCTSGYLGSDDYLGPLTGSTTGPVPLFTWNPVAGANGYFVIVAKDPAFSTIVDYAFTHIPAYAPRAGGSPRTYQNQSTHYYWVVLPSTNANGSGAATTPNNGAPQSFDRPKVGPDLVAPADGATVEGEPTFSWDPSAGARTYELLVSTDPNFAPGTGNKNIIEDITTSNVEYTSLTTPYPADVLYWEVRSIDYSGRQQPWSTPRTFTQTWPAPDFVSITNPTASDTVPTFSWNPVPGAISYTINIDEPSNGTITTTVDSTAVAPLSIWGLGDFAWHVQANFGGNGGTTTGPASADQIFTRSIHAPTGEGDLIPSGTASTPVLLWWNWKSGAKNYKVQISRDSSFTSQLVSTTTDMSSYAPDLSQSDWANLGQLYWRVAAMDTNGTQGTWSAVQPLSLATKLMVSTSASTMPKQTTKTITVTVKDAQGHVVSGAKVTVSGAGVTKTSKLTGSTGKASFKVHPTKAGTITWSATKSGSVTGKATTSVY
jgi:hypothetical protein